MPGAWVWCIWPKTSGFIASRAQIYRAFIRWRYRCAAKAAARGPAASALDHPNIAIIYEVGDFQVSSSSRWPTAKGRRSDVASKRDRSPCPSSLDCRNIARASRWHTPLGVVHRNLKPANVFFYIIGTVENSRLRSGQVEAARRTQRGPGTETGTALGTLSYMAPEQARGDHVSGRVGAGALLFEMFTGQLPFRGNSATPFCCALATEPAPSLHSLRPDAPAEFGTRRTRPGARTPSPHTHCRRGGTRHRADTASGLRRPRRRRRWRSIGRPIVAIPLVAALLVAIGATAVVGEPGGKRALGEECRAARDRAPRGSAGLRGGG